MKKKFVQGNTSPAIGGESFEERPQADSSSHRWFG